MQRTFNVTKFWLIHRFYNPLQYSLWHWSIILCIERGTKNDQLMNGMNILSIFMYHPESDNHTEYQNN